MKKIRFFIIAFILLFFATYTAGVRYIAPVCYRIDLSMAPVLMLTFCFFKEEPKACWLLLLGKELLTALFGNPGVSLALHLFLLLSNGLMDG